MESPRPLWRVSREDRWDGIGQGLGKNEQWVDGGSGLCLSTLTPAPTGTALLLLSKYCGSACDLMGGGRNSLKSIPLL